MSKLFETDFQLELNLDQDSGITETARMNRDLMLEAYQSLLAGNEDALIELLSEDVVFYEAESLPYGCTKTGIEGARQGVAAMLAAWQRMRISIEEFTAAGDLVIAYMTVAATSRSSGRGYHGPTAEVFRFKDHRIIEWRPIYWDTQAAASAIEG